MKQFQKIILIISIFYFSSYANTYSQKVLSLKSIFTEQDALLIPEIEGYWKLPAFDLTISFKKAGDNFYHLKYRFDTTEYEFEAVIVKIKDQLFLDLRGIMPDAYSDEDFTDAFVACHTIYRLSIDEEVLMLSSINYSWFYNYAIKKKMPLKYEWTENAMLLTCSTDELKSFLAEHIHEDDIFHDPDSLFIERDSIPKDTDTSTKHFIIRPKPSLSQECLPKFPFKDGWLGGDGDISVPMNDSITLFLFSDTYVGNKNQKSRQEQGMWMVSNTVAIQTCLPGRENSMQYYWNSMYSATPGPIFKSYTKRYRFWVVDAFSGNNNLYVILAKVGPKPGASPDEIFNFSGLGYTFARVTNPFDLPIEWKIDLIPMPEFKSSSFEIRCHATLDKYIYFFVCRNDTSHFLVRKQIEFIDQTDIPYEYYALNKKWKIGLIKDDMNLFMNGFRCNSVHFHPDIKQWIMINDIRFRDNKIKMRTAPSLTGPWSNEIVIYEIPEVTPGNSSYSNSNFCYLAREHIQYYDSINHLMLLTYDVNNTNYSEILANPKIYTPKIISIPLNKNDRRNH